MRITIEDVDLTAKDLEDIANFVANQNTEARITWEDYYFHENGDEKTIEFALLPESNSIDAFCTFVSATNGADMVAIRFVKR